MLRHYDALGLVSPSGRTAGGYRDYCEDDVRRLVQVEALRSLGLPLGRIEGVLRAPGASPADLVAQLLAATAVRLTRERQLLDRLKAVQTSRPTSWFEVLRVTELMRALASPSASQRLRAVMVHGRQDPSAAGVLVDAVLAEDDPVVGGVMQWALAGAGAACAPALIDAARSRDAAVRRRAVLALTRLPDDACVLAALRERLDDADPVVRRHAALTLGRRGQDRVVPELVGLIVTGDHDVEAAEVLGALARERACQEQAVAALREALEEPTASRGARMRLVQALVELGTAQAAQALRGLAGDRDPHVASLAAAFCA